jgi:hypothetical protein
MPYDHDAPVGLMGSRLYIEGPPQQLSHEQLRQLQQEQDQQQRDDQQQQQGVRPDEKAGGKPPLPPTRLGSYTLLLLAVAVKLRAACADCHFEMHVMLFHVHLETCLQEC